MLKLKLKHTQNVVLTFFALAVLVGCAAQRLRDNGMMLVQEGHLEEGLAKLEEASKAHPDNLAYRADLLRSKGQVSNRLLASASSERAVGHLDAAQAIYERLLKIDPNNQNAKAALAALVMDRRHDAMIEEARGLFANGDMEGARTALRPVLLENPKQGQAVMLQRQIDAQETKVQMAEPSLKGKFKKPVSLQFRDANVKMVFEALSRTSGINVLLDKDVKADIKTSIFVKDVSVEDAMDLILLQSQLQKKILNDNTVYIYPNIPAKIKDFQDLKIRSFHLTNADPKQMLTMIKTLLKTKDIFVHEKTNSLVMRDTPDAIHLAERLIADQDIADPEVMLEVEILEISTSRLSELGIKFPSQISLSPIQSLVAAAGATTGGSAANLTTQLTLDNLRKINGSNIAVGPLPSITLNAMLQDSDANILSSPRLRVRNREKAKIMIGERVPIITNTATPSGSGSVVTSTVTYQDVGLKLEVEPEIHLDSEVSIKVGLEVSSLGLAVNNTSTGSQVFRVGTRNTSTVLRLRDGETQILGGLITDEDKSTVDKVPALGQMPLLGHLFSSDNGNKTKTEIVLSITPHIVGNFKLPDAREMEYWSGTEAELRSTPLELRPFGAASLGSAETVASPPIAAPYTTAPAPVPVPVPVPAFVPRTPLVAVPRTANAESQAVQPASSAQLPMLSWQGPVEVKLGDRIMLSLNSKSTLGIKTFGFRVEFDPAVLQAVDVIEGDAMKRNNTPSNLTKNINQTGGEVSVALLGTGANVAASVATMIFEVIAVVPETAVSVTAITASGVTGKATSLASPEPHIITVVP